MIAKNWQRWKSRVKKKSIKCKFTHGLTRGVTESYFGGNKDQITREAKFMLLFTYTKLD